MIDAELLRVVGQVAGIGGLALGTFLLIVRAILKKLPAPRAVSAVAFLHTINRVILFAFVLAVLGLLLFGYLELDKRSSVAMKELTSLSGQFEVLKVKYDDLQTRFGQMQSDRNALNDRLLRIEEPNLKARASGFEVLSHEVRFDLSQWALVEPADIRTRKRSTIVTRATRTIERVQEEAKSFSSTYATGSVFDPVFQCSTHVLKVTENKDPFPAGKEAQRRWILDYDISGEPLFVPFSIVTDVTSWNALQNAIREHESTLIMFPTKHAFLEVVFPSSKPFKAGSSKCSYFRLGDNQSPTPIESPSLIEAQDGTSLKWDIERPLLGYHYQVEWEW